MVAQARSGFARMMRFIDSESVAHLVGHVWSSRSVFEQGTLGPDSSRVESKAVRPDGRGLPLGVATVIAAWTMLARPSYGRIAARTARW